MKMGLTPKQAECLEFIKSYMKENGGIAPTFSEMAAALGVSSKHSVHRLMTALEERGHIRRLPHKGRSVEIISASNPDLIHAWAISTEAERAEFRIYLKTMDQLT